MCFGVLFFSSQNALRSTHDHTLEHRVNGSGSSSLFSLSPSVTPASSLPAHLLQLPPPPLLSLPLSLSVRQNANIPFTSQLSSLFSDIFHSRSHLL